MTARTSLRTTDGPFTLDDYGAGVVVISIDHGIVDDKGRKIGGRAEIDHHTSSLFNLRIHATRDGVAFGALRRRSAWLDRDAVIKAAKAKLWAQGKRYRAHPPKPRKPRRSHSKDGRVRCDLCSPLRCELAP